jgi:hypothetical protein
MQESRTKNQDLDKEQRAKSKEQRAKNKEQRKETINASECAVDRRLRTVDFIHKPSPDLRVQVPDINSHQVFHYLLNLFIG